MGGKYKQHLEREKHPERYALIDPNAAFRDWTFGYGGKLLSVHSELTKARIAQATAAGSMVWDRWTKQEVK